MVSHLARLKTDNLRTRARAAIRTSVVTGELVAGQLYPVSYFASRLGVSATPIREALFDLAHEGLVESVRNRGFRIPLLTDHDLDEIFKIRLLLEVPSLRRLAGRLDKATILDCRRFALKTEECASRGDLMGFLENDRFFHERLLEPLNNTRLIRLVSQLRDAVRLYGLARMSGSPALVGTAEEHLSLLQALEANDGVTAEKLMKQHLSHTRGVWAGLPEPEGGSDRQRSSSMPAGSRRRRK